MMGRYDGDEEVAECAVEGWRLVAVWNSMML